MANKLMLHKIIPFVYYNYGLKFVDCQFNEPSYKKESPNLLSMNKKVVL